MGVTGWLTRVAGSAAGSMAALALLVCGCVFAALAGPALSLHTRSEALHQTLAGLSGTTKTVQAATDVGSFTGAIGFDSGNGAENLTAGQLGQARSELGRGLARLGLPLGPDPWTGLTSKLYLVSGAGPQAQPPADAPPKLEVTYRDQLASYSRLAAGSFSSRGTPPGAVAVVASTATAARFGLRPGHLVSVAVSGPVRLFVTGIVTERAPGSSFWGQDLLAGTPQLNLVPQTLDVYYWAGAVIADPSQLAALQNAFSGPGLALDWEFPLAVGNLTADRAQTLSGELSQAATATPALTGALAEGAGALTVSSPLAPDLAAFLATQAAIQTVLLLLFVSLMVVGATVILLAARMMVTRREVELAVLRARGGSLRQVAAVLARAAAITTGPATAVGVALAAGLIPGAGAPASDGWPLAAIAVAAALAGAPLIAAWQYRQPTPPGNPALILSADTGRRRPGWRRLVAEVTVCAAAAAGLVVLHDQGVPAGGGTDLYLALTPVLVAVPVVVILLRLYPLALRGLLILAARRRGATGFLALSGAARSSLTGMLPAFALVLVLSLATFAGTVTSAISRGEVTASWNTTGGDAVIKILPGLTPIGPAQVRALARVRGVRRVTAVENTIWVTPFGQGLVVVGVDPHSYAALLAGTPFPAVPAASLVPAPGGTLKPGAVAPVLASPAAAAILGPSATQLTTMSPIGPIRVRVAGIITSTAAQPTGAPFVVMPLETLPGPAGAPAPNEALITGPDLDRAQLTAVAHTVIPDGVVTFRATVLSALTGSPLQHGATLIITITLVTAAGFGLFILVLGLALGSADRQLTWARLTLMGHERATRLALAEVMPAVLAAVVAGSVCAVALPALIGTSIDLSAFTGTSAPVKFQLDLLAFGLPAVAVLVVAPIVLVAQSAILRRRDVTGPLRAG